MQYYSKQFGIIKQHLLTYFNQKTSGLSPHIRRTINEISYGVLDVTPWVTTSRPKTKHIIHFSSQEKYYEKKMEKRRRIRPS